MPQNTQCQPRPIQDVHMPKRPATSASWSQPKAGTTRALHQHQHQRWGRRTDAVRTKNLDKHRRAVCVPGMGHYHQGSRPVDKTHGLAHPSDMPDDQRTLLAGHHRLAHWNGPGGKLHLVSDQRVGEHSWLDAIPERHSRRLPSTVRVCEPPFLGATAASLRHHHSIPVIGTLGVCVLRDRCVQFI